jgi:hypothetical protein
MEATTELQHVGGNRQLHKGERKYLSPAVDAENFPSGCFSAGWDSTYYGSAAIRWPEVSQNLYVEVVLGINPCLMNSAHWQDHIERYKSSVQSRNAAALYKPYISLFCMHSVV